MDETSNETTEEVVIEDEKETTVSDQTEETVEKEVETAEEPAEPSVIYPDGVTVEADENSRTGYTAHFVYDPVNNNGIEIPEGETITGVRVTGSFRLISNPEEVSLSEGSDHSLYEYENGDFVANVHPHTRESG